MNTNISLLERCNCNWVSLLKDLRGDEKVKEEQELERVAEGGEGYIEVLLDAGDVVARLEARIRQILRKKEWLQASKVEKHTETDLLHTEHVESSPS